MAVTEGITMKTVQAQAIKIDNLARPSLGDNRSDLSVRRAGKEALAWVGIGVFALIFCALELVVGEPR